MGWLQDKLGRLTGQRPSAPTAPAAGSATGDAAERGGTAAPAIDWRARGNEALRAGDLAGAARCYAQGIEADPDDPLLRLNHGFVLLELGQPAAAAERLQQALALRRPADTFAHDAHFLLGRALAAGGAAQQALAQFEAAVQARPDFAEPLEEAVRLLQGLQRPAEAVAWAQRLAALRPSGANRLLLASLQARTGQAEAAQAVVADVCATEPVDANESFRRFQLLLEMGRHAQARDEAERTLRLTGHHPDALVNSAVALARLGRLDDARERLDEALRLAPGHRGALVNQVHVLTEQLRLQDAIEVARAGLRSFPDDADLHWNMALCHLLRGEFAEGWREHEWRLRNAAFRHKVARIDAPPWQGESLAGRTILLHAEQGFGDNIQFVRFVPEVARRARQVLLHVAPPLHPLMRDILPANCRLVSEGDAPGAIDCHAPLLSLPAILGTTLETIPAQVPYLHAEAATVQAWRERLGAGGLRVGVAWSGNPTHANDHNRSMPLAEFRAIAADGCRFHTVQPDTRESDREELAAWAEAEDTGRGLRDFADTAALVQALDLVVTVDTGVAHLAGALGKPVSILLPYAPDWRWLLDRTDSPWYPTARLYRQEADRDWAPVLARVRADLAALARRA